MQIKQNPYITQTTLILFLCFLLAFVQCKRTTESETSSADSTAIDTINISTVTADNESSFDETTAIHDVVEYYGAADDEIKTVLSIFSPFDAVNKLAILSVHIKDSVESLRETQELTDPKDSLIFKPYESKAYKALLDYKKLMESGLTMRGECPGLLQLNRVTAEGDSTAAILPSARQSKLFERRDFFFLGGAPFIMPARKDDIDVFYDAKGNPESRFYIETENADFLLTSIAHFNTLKFTITFGGPLDSYDGGPQEVNGFGTVIHTLIDRIPVLFLTKTGLVKGHFTGIILNLVPQNLGCVSDLPEPEFACAENLNAGDILGIYFPYGSNDISTCTFKQQNNVWTVDLNGDGIDDLAGVSSSSAGEASGGILSEMLWFVNVDGTWEIIDWGHDLDCT